MERAEKGKRQNQIILSLGISFNPRNFRKSFCYAWKGFSILSKTTCLTETHSSKIDLILTNNSNSFQKSGTTETGLSDFHKLISSFFKSYFSRLSPKVIYYRNYKNSDESKCIEKDTLKAQGHRKLFHGTHSKNLTHFANLNSLNTVKNRLLQYSQKLYSFYKFPRKHLHCIISRRPRTSFSKHLEDKCLHIPL